MQQQGLRGVAVCWSVASALEFGVWKVNTKAPVLMTVWSAARGAGRLSKRGHSFCLRSLAGPIHPPRTSPAPALCPLPSPRKRGGGLHASLSLLWPFVTRHCCRGAECPHSPARLYLYFAIYRQVLQSLIHDYSSVKLLPLGP